MPLRRAGIRRSLVVEWMCEDNQGWGNGQNRSILASDLLAKWEKFAVPGMGWNILRKIRKIPRDRSQRSCIMEQTWLGRRVVPGSRLSPALQPRGERIHEHPPFVGTGRGNGSGRRPGVVGLGADHSGARQGLSGRAGPAQGDAGRAGARQEHARPAGARQEHAGRAGARRRPARATRPRRPRTRAIRPRRRAAGPQQGLSGRAGAPQAPNKGYPAAGARQELPGRAGAPQAPAKGAPQA